MKSIKKICSWFDRAFSFKASPWKVSLVILLVATILLMEGSDPRFQAEASPDDEVVTVEEYVEMGRVLVFRTEPQKTCNKPAGPVTAKEFADFGRVLIFGRDFYKPLPEGVGKGRCPLCHTFNPGEQIGLCHNLYGVEERSHSRIREDRYLNEPISIGEMDKDSRIVKGAPDLIPEKYRREGSLEMTGEDYLRESLMCPSCYVVEGYGKESDTKSPMPVIHNRLSNVELNAVIAWLQAKDTPGNYSRVTVPLPKRSEIR